MSIPRPTSRRIPRWLSISAILTTFGVGVVSLMLWLVGAFSPKIRSSADAPLQRPVGDAKVIEVAVRSIPLEETAVGTIQPVHRVELASRLLAKAMTVHVVAGQKVSKGESLVRLEDTDLKARLAQADAAVAQAQSALDQARVEESRMRTAFESKAVASVEMDRAVNALKGAEANFTRAIQARAEAQSVLAYATITSPIDGTVIDKRVSEGDTVAPGQVVVTLLDPTRMQLVASVRESLTHRLAVGATVSVKLDALDHACPGKVSEIVPEADAESRTFQVKVVGPCPEGIYAGMFGRLSIPVGDETLLLVPRTAVQTVGQIHCVDVASDKVRHRRAVRLGRVMGDEVEILSGLVAGERIVAHAASGGR